MQQSGLNLRGEVEIEIYTNKCGIQVPCTKIVEIQTRLDQEH